MLLSRGEIVGPYVIVRPLGAGGMGDVYLARDTRLRRDIALKVLREEGAPDQARVRRFEQEARAASALNHPSIVVVHDVGEARSGSPPGLVRYLAMEFLDGEALSSALRERPFDTHRCLDIAVPLADALARAHESGIVHRDLKPSNIILTAGGHPKLVDFGIAKLRVNGADGAWTAPGTSEDTLTSPGTLLGTVGYMSPEQARGEPATATCDQFSFGCILYEMLAGRRAFQGASAAEVVSAILRDEPEPLDRFNPSVPPPLRWLIERCLAKSPADRYVSTRDLALELRTIRDHVREVGPSSGRAAAVDERRRGRWKVWTTALVVVAAVTAVTLAVVLPPRPQPEFRPLTFRRGLVGHALFAPNSDAILYTASWEGQPARTFQTLPGSEGFDRSLDAAEQFPLSYAADGSQVLVLLGVFRPGTNMRGTLAWWPALGGKAREILEDVSWSDWNDAARFFAVSRDAGPERVLEARDAAGAVQRTLFRTDGGISCVRISPDGRRVAFIHHPNLYMQRGEVWVVGSDGADARALTPTFDQLLGLDWNRRTGEVWFSGAPANFWGSTVWAVGLRGRPRSVYALPSMHILTSVAPSGDRCLFRDVDDESTLVVRVPGQPLRNMTWFGWTVVTDLSPDGRRVLFYDGGATEKTHGTWMRSIDGGDAVRLGEGVPSRFSPDGKWIVMPTRPSEGPSQLALLPVGPGQRRSLTSSDAPHEWPVFVGPTTLLFVRPHGAESGVWRMEIDGTGARYLGAPGCQAPEPSPSATHFVCVGEGGRALFVYPMDPGAGRKLHELEPGQEFKYSRWGRRGDTIHAVARDRRFLTLRAATGDVLSQEVLPLPGAGPYDNLIGAALDADAHVQTYSVAQRRSGLFLMTNVK